MPVKTTQIYQVIRNTIVASSFLLLILLISANVPVKTHVRADFKLGKEISFVVNEPTRFSSIPFSFLQIGKFSQVVIPPHKLVPSEKQVALPLNIIPESDFSTVQFRFSKENGKKQLARLPFIRVPEGTKITLRIDEYNPNKLEIKLEGKLQEAIKIHTPETPLQLTVDNCKFDGDYQPPNDDEVTLNFTDTSDDISFDPLKIGSDKVIELSLELNSDLELRNRHPIFGDISDNGIKIKNLELFYTEEKREKHTSLIGGLVYYIGYPKKNTVALLDTDRVEFDKTEELILEKILFSPTDSIEFSGSSLDLRVQGILTHEAKIATNLKPSAELRLSFYESWVKWESFDVISDIIALAMTIFSAVIGLIAARFEKDD